MLLFQNEGRHKKKPKSTPFIDSESVLFHFRRSKKIEDQKKVPTEAIPEL